MLGDDPTFTKTLSSSKIRPILNTFAIQVVSEKQTACDCLVLRP